MIGPLDENASAEASPTSSPPARTRGTAPGAVRTGNGNWPVAALTMADPRVESG